MSQSKPYVITKAVDSGFFQGYVSPLVCALLNRQTDKSLLVKGLPPKVASLKDVRLHDHESKGVL